VNVSSHFGLQKQKRLTAETLFYDRLIDAFCSPVHMIYPICQL